MAETIAVTNELTSAMNATRESVNATRESADKVLAATVLYASGTADARATAAYKLEQSRVEASGQVAGEFIKALSKLP